MPKSAPVLVDFESRSRCDLKRRGGRIYWEDPSSEPIVAVLCNTETGEAQVWEPGDATPNLALAVAHNASTFDRHAAQASGWQVERWLDSSHMARRAGLPGKLDALAKRWLGRPKDDTGSKLTKGLSRVSRAKKTFGQLPEITPEIRARVTAYCVDDVSVMVDAWPRLAEWIDVDADVAEADAAINERGIRLDTELVDAMLKAIDRDQERQCEETAKLLRGTPKASIHLAGTTPELRALQAQALLGPDWNAESARDAAMSPAQLCKLTGLPNAQAKTLDDIIRAQGDRAHPLLKLRRALASIVPGKLRAALERVSRDGMLRDSHHYMGAHTGRWSSKGMQHHNLPRVSFEDDAHAIGWDVADYIEALVDGVKRGQMLTKKQFDGLLRAVLCADDGQTLCTWDYGGIEARCLAWAAGDAKALDVFRAYDAGQGPNPYCIAATGIFGRTVTKKEKTEYGVGKIAELMLGYGAGHVKYAESCEKAGVDLVAAGVDAEDVVRTWRKARAHVPKLWRDCEHAFAAACNGKRAVAGPWVYEPHSAASGSGGVDVWCVLPSGRPIVYSEARATRGQRGWDLSYQGHLFRDHVYGGLLVENAVQATCRDFLADALVRCEADGLRPQLHVHDEVVCGIDDAAADEGMACMKEIMSDPPEWADGMPIVLEGFKGKRYRK
jgi:DNA polymerase